MSIDICLFVFFFAAIVVVFRGRGDIPEDSKAAETF